MPMTNVNFEIDSDIERRMSQACKEMGLTVSAAFSIFAAKVANERCIPFIVSADPFYSESNMKQLKKAISDIENGKAEFHDLDEIEEEPDPNDPFYCETNQRILKESIAELERGNYQIHDIIEVDENN